MIESKKQSEVEMDTGEESELEKDNRKNGYFRKQE